MFVNKDRNPHQSCVIYEENCNCGESYIGETIRNVESRWKEHNNVNKDSEPAQHLKENPNHFTWKVLLPASKNSKIRKDLEASLVAKMRPSLNEQMDFNKLLLFRNGVT